MNFAIVGDPVSHSRSPALHNAAFETLGLDAHFAFMHVVAKEFASVTRALRSGELDGVSVTMPHKRTAFDAVNDRSDTAAYTGAVNTIIVEGDRLVGHNTDVAGVSHALESSGVDAEAPVLILGAGGAAAAALRAVDGGDVSISARDVNAANELAARSEHAVGVVPWGEPVTLATVINATPLGMHGETLPPGIIERAGALVDMTYSSHHSPSIMVAISLGLPYADGITMLVGQAVEAFELFTGCSAPVATMEQAARSV